MVKIIGVRFRNAGKVYYFDPKDYEIKSGDHVIVETVRGVEYGTVVGDIRSIDDKLVVQPLKSVLRVATAEDDARAQRSRDKERDALRICQEKIQKHKLDMKLIDAEYTFDNNKVLFYFTADGRIDFRELVKDLAAVFKMRIELRQIGVRDETKILGGVGICGRVLCCNSYLSEFVPVSIKMAKEQNLSLNPTKISGVCGRLMCCLKNEEDTYEYLNSRLPAIGESVVTADGQKGEVSSVNVLRQRVKVLIDVDDEKELQEFDVSELKFKPRRRKEKGKDKNRGGREKEPREKDGREKEPRDKDGREKEPRDKDGREKEPRNKDSREKEPRERDGKEKGSQEKEGRERGREKNRERREKDRSRDGEKEKGRERDRDKPRDKGREHDQNRKGQEADQELKKEPGESEAPDRKEGKSKPDDN